MRHERGSNLITGLNLESNYGYAECSVRLKCHSIRRGNAYLSIYESNEYVSDIKVK